MAPHVVPEHFWNAERRAKMRWFLGTDGRSARSCAIHIQSVFVYPGLLLPKIQAAHYFWSSSVKCINQILR